MKPLKETIRFLLLLASVHGCCLPILLPTVHPLWAAAAALLFVLLNLFPTLQKRSTLRLRVLSDGAALLSLFLATTIAGVILFLSVWIFGAYSWKQLLAYGAIIALAEAILFWNGILRVYCTSLQLGIKWRVIGVLCGMIPVVHLLVLLHIIDIVRKEVALEEEKCLLDAKRAKDRICETKYPLLLVHGVFFRDNRFLNYWGRIPAVLTKNGAAVYYGGQESAASVADCAAQLAERIREICQTTGCEKVNIIAHSKGGLDSRYAISQLGMDSYVASLTTINTPHQGCAFAEYLLNKAPEALRRSVSDAYNKTLLRLGDKQPDFLSATENLTASYCKELNRKLPNKENVYYQSVGSKLKKATGGKFPLNFSYHLVNYFDGENDGLVSFPSMEWGERFIQVSAPGARGVSHGDMIDLNRENIPGFDVREFYVNLVRELKEMGF